MRNKANIALRALLSIALALGMCPIRGIAEEAGDTDTIKVESTDEEQYAQIGGASEGTDVPEAESEEDCVTAESEPVYVARARIVNDTLDPKLDTTVNYSDLEVALMVLNKQFQHDDYDEDRYITLDLVQSASVTKDFPDDFRIRQAHVTINLNGCTANMSGRSIELNGSGSQAYPNVKQTVTIGDVLGGGMLSCHRILVAGSTYSGFIRPRLIIEGGILNGDIEVGENATYQGEVQLDGGTIHGNVKLISKPASASDPIAQFIMSGGTITNSAGVGVSVGADSTFCVSGAPTITGSKDGNVCLSENSIITVNGPLTDGACIGVTTATKPTAGNPVVFTSGYDTHNPNDDPAKFFTSDDPRYCVTWNADKSEAVLAVHDHAWGYTASGNTLTATCANANCPAKGGNVQTLTLDVPTKTYDGKAATATVTASAGWTTTNGLVQVPDASAVTFSSTPVGAGTYTARLSVPGAGKGGAVAVLEKTFRIDPAPLTITARDKTIAFGKAPANDGVTYEGFVGSEGTPALSGSLSYDYGGYVAGSAAGTYPITPSGLTATNYAITYRAGTLTVLSDDLPASVPVTAVAHVQKKGTLPASTGVGQVIGTTGKGRRLESIRLSLSDQPLSGGIEYRAHVQKSGWQGWKKNGALAGTQGKARRIEAIQMCLTGQMGEQYDVYYRVHVQKYGWMAWAKNGTSAGTTGKRLRAEAVQVVIVRKGAPAPGRDYNGVTQTYGKAFVRK